MTVDSEMGSVAKNGANPSTSTVALAAEIGAAQADLERLDALLADAAATLVESFGAVAAFSEGQSVYAIPLQRAATALQFQDLASQLIAHTRGRLSACVRGTPAYNLSQPVRQHDLDEGSIELFQGEKS
jgi:hypothetical protein